MTAPNIMRWMALSALLTACGDDGNGPGALQQPTLAVGSGPEAVVVNPNANGNGIAATIQEGINRVSPGGMVLITPGVYDERITIDKGVTLAGIADGSGPVVIEQNLPASAGTGTIALVSVTTREPVVIRDVTVHHVHLRGLNALTAADLTIERVAFRGEFPSPGAIFNNGVSVVNNAAQSGARARLVVMDSYFEVFGNALSLGGDVDAVIARNVFNHTVSNGGCLFVSPTGQGVTVPAGAATNVEVLHNEFVDCGATVPEKLSSSLSILGTVGATTTGSVNIVGNMIRNTTRTPPSCNTTGILYEFFSGRIEHNIVAGAVAPCAPPSARAFPAGIFVGSRIAGIRAANVVVRFNDITGNAFAGLRIGGNQSSAIDARCNWWGSASGPSGAGPGSGDALAVEAGAATPAFLPFAVAPIAETSALEACTP